jgi:hypothetical protein
MRKIIWLCALSALAGCSGMNNTDRGMLAGGLLGAGAGTVIGGANGKPGAGALIVAGTGALLGGLVGNAEDKAERRAEAIARQNPPLAIPDVIRMAQQHISDDIIIRQIHTTGSVYHLTPYEIQYLKSQGVSDRVVMEMQSRRAAIVPARQTVYVVDPPPPPVSVGVGFGYGWGPRYHHHHRHGCWW